MLSRHLLLTLAALVGAAIVDGMLGAGWGFFGRAWIGWLIVGGLAAIVIAAIGAQVHALPAEAHTEADAYYAAVEGQTELIASALIIIGIALLLGTCAPTGALGGGAAAEFTVWAGLVTLLMGVALAIAKRTIGGRRPNRQPASWSEPQQPDAASQPRTR